MFIVFLTWFVLARPVLPHHGINSKMQKMVGAGEVIVGKVQDKNKQVVVNNVVNIGVASRGAESVSTAHIATAAARVELGVDTSSNPLSSIPSSISQASTWWQCIAFHESTDNLTAINPYSGDQGMFQDAISTWREYAPIGYPSEPIWANFQQQYYVNTLILKADGVRAWVTSSLC